MFTLMLGVLAFAKEIPESSPDHAYHYQGAPVSVDGVTFTAPVAWARQAELTFKVAIENTTTDWVLLRKDGLSYLAGGGAFAPKDNRRFEIVKPNGKGAHTFGIADELGRMHHREMAIRLREAWRVDPTGTALSTPPTSLPATARSFTVGGFSCELSGKVTQETDKTAAKYECIYNAAPGTVGIVHESAAQFKTATGLTFANEEGGKRDLVLPGDKVGIKLKVTAIQPGPHGVDMQKSVLTVDWTGVFAEAPLRPIAVPEWTFTLNEALTAEKNR
jgi:hypothetical protein